MKLTFKEYLTESKSVMYQVRIGNDDWKDRKIPYASLEEIRECIADEKGDLSFLTEIVQEWIGDGPNGKGTSWDEMEFDVQSFKSDVLKVTYTFAGIKFQSPSKGEVGQEIKKSGVITIMPGNEAVAEGWKICAAA